MKITTLPSIINRIAILSICLSIPTLSFGHGLDCNSAPVTFDEPLAHNFVLENLSSGSENWTNLSGCIDTSNRASGDLSAACASSTGQPAILALVAPDPYIGCKSSVVLNFKGYFKNDDQSAQLKVQILPPSSQVWTDLMEWNETHQTGGSGEDVSIDLSAFSSNGFGQIKIRWVFVAGTPGTYVQLDNALLTCTNAPTADLDLKISGDPGPIPAGAIRRYSFQVKNFGPKPAQNILFELGLDGVGKVVGTDVDNSAPLINNNYSENSLGSFSDGMEQNFYVDVRFLKPSIGGNGASTVSGQIVSEVSGSVCDPRTNNNVREKRVLVDPGLELSAAFFKDLQKLEQVLSNLRAWKGCSIKPTSQSKRLFTSLFSNKAKARLTQMLPSEGYEILQLSSDIKSNGTSFVNNAFSCQSPALTKALRSTKKYRTKLKKLFLD